MGHHYVPQHYLREFQVPDEPGAIWAYDKVLHRSMKVPIKTIAQEADFYDVEVERELSEPLEGPAQSCLAKLRARERLSSDERLLVAAYVATMMMRVPKQRAKAVKIVPSALKSTVDDARALIQKWAVGPDTDQALVASRLAEVDRLEIEWAQSPPPDLVDRIRSPWPSAKIVALVDSMAWRIIRATEAQSFLTSDNPSFVFEAYGIGKPESEITFPLSSDTALLASWQGPIRGLLEFRRWSAAVREINRRVAAGSDRFVFFHKSADWVRVLAEKQRSFLSRIQWLTA